ncbi:MAG: cyclic nucleotide-binding protein [Thalassobius sp.]|nr:cyclic nucleotide-binding protein [Thalassovita sp.]
MKKENLLKDFLGKFTILSDKEVEELSQKLNVKEYKKGNILQSVGEVPTLCFFVLDGCVRQYHFIEGVEKTTDFYTSKNGAIASDCYVLQKPSPFFLECSDDCILLVGDPELDQKLFAEYPILKSIITEVMEKEWLKTRNELATFKHSSPEQRYLNLLENNADLLNIVPNHQIASYLGITPESLSRIRKRLLTKSKLQ